MKGIIDFHTHAFPDDLAERAMTHLKEKSNVAAFLDGRLDSLIDSMDNAGIERSVIASIATKPKQFEPILAWSRQIASDRIVPFISFHPEDPNVSDHIDRIVEAGFKGVKLHPYYQEFEIDDETRMFPIYEKLADVGLILLMHTGFDIAFPRDPIADPPRIRNVVDRFDNLKLVTSHLGAWEDWQRTHDLLAGRNVYMEISYARDYIDDQLARKILLDHPAEFLLFGTDSPWHDQAESVQWVKKLQLGEDRERRLFRENARKLLED